MNPFVRFKKIKQNIGGNTIKILSNVAWAMGGKIVKHGRDSIGRYSCSKIFRARTIWPNELCY